MSEELLDQLESGPWPSFVADLQKEKAKMDAEELSFKMVHELAVKHLGKEPVK